MRFLLEGVRGRASVGEGCKKVEEKLFLLTLSEGKSGFKSAFSLTIISISCNLSLLTVSWQTQAQFFMATFFIRHFLHTLLL